MARHQTVTERSGSAIDTRAYSDAAKALRKGSKHLNRELRKRLRKAGEIMAVEARSIASEHSEKIPPTVKVRVAGATVAVVAGGEKAPIAGLFELGNTGNKSKSASASRGGKFRHPVFGNRENWVDQDMHPFLLPAAEATKVEAQKEILKVLSETQKIVATEYYKEND
jgi:hypothetical protein